MKPIFETCQPRSFDNTWCGREGAPRGRPVNNSTEVAYSLALAQLLRHEGLNAQGEQRHTCGQARRQADALLDFDDYAVVIKAEFGAPAKTDADKRFPPDQRAMVGGLPLRIAVAEGYPERLADRPESDTNSNLAAATDLTISHRYHGDEPGESVGTVARLLGAQQGRADRGSYAPPQRVAQRGRAARRERSRGRGDRRPRADRNDHLQRHRHVGPDGGGVREVR